MPDAQRAEIAKLEALHAEHPQGRIFTHLAEAYRKAGELDRAREVLAEGIERHPDYSSAHVVLARVLADSGQRDGAEAEFQRVLELDSHNLVALRALGDLARDGGRRDEALEYYRRLLDVEPSDPDVRDAIQGLEGSGIDAGFEAAPAQDAGYGDMDLGGAEGASEPWVETASDDLRFQPSADDGSAAAAGSMGGPLEGLEQSHDAMDLPAGAMDMRGDATGTPPEGTDEPRGAMDLPDDAMDLRGDAMDLPGGDVDLAGGDVDPSGGAVEASGGDAELTGGDIGLPDYPTEPSELDGSPWSFDGSDERAGDAPDADEGAPWVEGGEADEGAGFPSLSWAGEEEQEPEMEPPETGEPGVMTETIAQVYARQGLYDRAAEVYRELVRARPDDESLRSRMEEMEALAEQDARAADAATVPGLEPGSEPAQVPGLETGEIGPAPDVEPLEGLETDTTRPMADHSYEQGGSDPWSAGDDLHAAPWTPDQESEDLDSAEDRQAAVQDESVESVWTGAQGASDEQDSPYAWAEETDAEAETDESGPISDYFRDLLGWSGTGSETATGQDTAREDTPPADTAPEDAAGDTAAEGTPPVTSAESRQEVEPGQAEEATASSDDEDLDTFRSWLESLKQ